ncbi:rhodanese [Halobacteriales archaeon QS_1_68_17]|nr:MAG: rhodanese [Halobacteriales archaeon QS_1_68_17]
MRRRDYLRVGGVLAAGIGAGCLGSDAAAANRFDYGTTRTRGVEVPLVPVADAIEWYENDDAVFADARSRAAYESAHIAGALLSPAPDGQAEGDPLADLDQSTRITTYCGCPHHLSSLRGSTLIKNGYERTYALDEGFVEWRDQGHPIEGSQTDSNPDLFTISGRTDPAADGKLAWVWHDPSGQREAAPIDADGRFALDVRFYDVTAASVVRLRTPAGEVTGHLGDLAGGTVEL